MSDERRVTRDGRRAFDKSCQNVACGLLVWSLLSNRDRLHYIKSLVQTALGDDALEIMLETRQLSKNDSASSDARDYGTLYPSQRSRSVPGQLN